MRALFCEHPSKSLKGGYCSYYSEIYHALNEVFDIDFKNFIPRKTSEFDDYDLAFLGFGHTDCSEGTWFHRRGEYGKLLEFYLNDCTRKPYYRKVTIS